MIETSFLMIPFKTFIFIEEIIQSADEEHEEDHGEVLEEGDIDISDTEKFLDENGIEIERDIIADGLKNIWERHWQKIEKSLDLWANLC